MKIIDKYKDYYDFMVGVYGMDEDIIYDRRKKENIKPTNRLSICYEVDNYYTTEKLCSSVNDGVSGISAILKYDETLTKKNNKGSLFSFDFSLVIGSTKYTFYHKKGSDKIELKKKEERKVFAVDKNGVDLLRDVPIYIKGRFGYITNPILEGSVLVNLFSPEFVWNEVYNYLIGIREPVIVDNRTDNEKIISNGFDTVTSFRKIK